VVDAFLLVGLFDWFDSNFEGARKTDRTIWCYRVTVIALWLAMQLHVGLEHLV